MPQRPYGPVEVNVCQFQQVRKRLLRQRHLKTVALGKARRSSSVVVSSSSVVGMVTPVGVGANNGIIYGHVWLERRRGAGRLSPTFETFQPSCRVPQSGRSFTLSEVSQAEVFERDDHEVSRDCIALMAADGRQNADMVQFDDVTPAEAAKTMNEGSAVTLVLTDARVAGLRVSGRFRAGEPERFARSGSQLLSRRVVRVSGDRIDLRRQR